MALTCCRTTQERLGQDQGAMRDRFRFFNSESYVLQYETWK